MDTSLNPAMAAAILAAEQQRQSAQAAARAEYANLQGPDPSSTLTALIKQSDIQYYRSLIVAALANGQTVSPFKQALVALGTGGS